MRLMTTYLIPHLQFLILQYEKHILTHCAGLRLTLRWAWDLFCTLRGREFSWPKKLEERLNRRKNSTLVATFGYQKKAQKITWSINNWTRSLNAHLLVVGSWISGNHLLKKKTAPPYFHSPTGMLFRSLLPCSCTSDTAQSCCQCIPPERLW